EPPPDFSVFVPFTSAFWLVLNRPPSARGTALNASVVLPARLALVAEFLLALTFSVITIVRMSPTLRGRRSSNSGLPAYEDAKIEPVAGPGARGSARAVVGNCTSGSLGISAQPPLASVARPTMA